MVTSKPDLFQRLGPHLPIWLLPDCRRVVLSMLVESECVKCMLHHWRYDGVDKSESEGIIGAYLAGDKGGSYRAERSSNAILELVNDIRRLFNGNTKRADRVPHRTSSDRHSPIGQVKFWVLELFLDLSKGVCCLSGFLGLGFHILLLPCIEDAEKVTQAMLFQNAEVGDQRRDYSRSVCAAREADQDDLISPQIVVAQEPICLSDVFFDT